MVPDLAIYDVIEVSSSAGKDSLAMLAYVCALCTVLGILEHVVVVHADLGRVEWPGTRDIAEAQAKHFGVRFEVVKRPQGDLLAHVRKLRKWPMPTQRFCTADHERGQILRVLTRLADEVRAGRADEIVARPVRVLNCIGLRAEESPGRAARPPLVRDKRASGKGERKVVDVWLPIQEMTAEDVWRACRASGAPIHPAYAAGLPMASCVLCIYAPLDALLIAGRAHPALLAEYVEVEREIGHTFKRHLPIAQIAADIAAGVEPSGPVESWCM